jgi:predicted AlkP superfamily pyrophosphatase or phosphodiesterase
MQYGKPIKSVLKALRPRKIRSVHIFVIDGCRADAFEEAVFRRNVFPLFRKYIDKGYLYFRNCYTAFPSVTLPCHASLLTGSFPGTHGIVGNNWFRQTFSEPGFDEAQKGYVRFGTENNPGLFRYFGLANAHLGGEL